LDSHEVMRIEYYPTHLFSDSKESRESKQQTKKESKASETERREEEEIGRKMNKTALITLWVAPEEHQIVKFTFDNVWMDFLPAAWLVRIDGLRASMEMGQPFQGVWLPKNLSIHAGLTSANDGAACRAHVLLAGNRVAVARRHRNRDGDSRPRQRDARRRRGRAPRGRERWHDAGGRCDRRDRAAAARQRPLRRSPRAKAI